MVLVEIDVEVEVEVEIEVEVEVVNVVDAMVVADKRGHNEINSNNIDILLVVFI